MVLPSSHLICFKFTNVNKQPQSKCLVKPLKQNQNIKFCAKGKGEKFLKYIKFFKDINVNS